MDKSKNNNINNAKDMIPASNKEMTITPSNVAAKAPKLNKDAGKGFNNIIDLWKMNINMVGSDKTAIIMNEDDGSIRKFTFGEMDTLSNKIANWLTSQSLKRDDTIALFMENRPEYVATWLGAAKIGVKVSLINTSIVGKPLVHSIKICNANMIILNYELRQPVKDILHVLKSELSKEIPIWTQNPFSGSQSKVPGGNTPSADYCPCMNEAVLKSSSEEPSSEFRKGIKLNSQFGYIYTSGTTGLPKAAIIPHLRMIRYGFSIKAFGVTSDDVFLTHMPLFHTAGGGIGSGSMVVLGCTLIIRKKFSATRFFEDAAIHNATVAQYIGELCKFLLYSQPTKYDRAHKLRIMIGNGLRPEIWEAFQDRFAIPEIGEFYGATEGNGSLFNHCKSPEGRGACGQLSDEEMKRAGMKFAKFNVKTEELVRDSNGRCLECDVNEPGELLFPIKPNDITTEFSGYESKEATDKKVVKDAFTVGDKYFRTGDLLRRSEKGYVYFVDRIGDTFRWKGENCSTTEVTEVLQGFDGIFDCNVYGIQIPNNLDGRAPMAALVLSKSDIDLKEFAKFVTKNLPSYARPLFIRIATRQLSMTQTLKQQKVELRNEGIDLELIKKSGDKVYWLSPDSGTYEPFGETEHHRATRPGSRL